MSKTIIVYTPSELKESHPDGFEKALDWWRSTNNDEIPWRGEIMASFEAIFKASGIHIRDWSINGDYPSQSYVRFDFRGFYNSGVEDLTGNRALAWIENNLLYDLREKRTFINRVKKYEHWYDFTKYGEIPSCPFTGYCADEDFIESLLKSIKSGDTLGEAYSDLAHVAGKMLESEIEYQNSEECFLEQEHLEFTEDGHHI